MVVGRVDGPVVPSLRRLSRVVSEILVVADSRIPECDLPPLEQCGARVVRADFEYLEFHLPWIHKQCAADWVLRLDSDEFISDALLLELPQLIESRNCDQYWIPRRWLFPNLTTWLSEGPWWPDPQLRLVRNIGSLAFSGQLHSSATPQYPSGLAAGCLYHLELMQEDLPARWKKAARYEGLRPGLVAQDGFPTNGYYLPERFSRGSLSHTPSGDLEGLVEAANYQPPRSPEVDYRAPFVSREEFALHLTPTIDQLQSQEVRVTVADTMVLDTLVAGESTPLPVEIYNGGVGSVPFGPDADPPVRIGWKWWAGTELIDDSGRAYVSQEIGGHSHNRQLVNIVAPEAPGAYELELDFCIEGGGWNGSGTKYKARISARPSGTRFYIDESSGAMAQYADGSAVGKVLIPQVIHQVWLGASEMPREYRIFRDTWRRCNPEFKSRVWTDETVKSEFPDLDLSSARNPAEASNVLRYHVIARYGGIYVDCDIEARIPISPYLSGVTLFAGLEVPGRVCNALFGAVAEHPAMQLAAQYSTDFCGRGVQPFNTGPQMLTMVLAQYRDATIFPETAFYPYRWDESKPQGRSFEGSIAVHHWGKSWVK